MPKKNLNKPWSPSDLKVMRKCAKDGKSARECAKDLGRSRGAVAYKAMVEGVSFRAIKQKPHVQRKLARLRMKTGRMDVTFQAAA